MSTSVSVRYDLKSPAEVVNGLDLTPSKVMRFKVKGCVEEGQNKYYDRLKDAVSEARIALGRDLTAWRDEVGNAEQSKETKKTLKYEEDDDGEDDD